MLIYYPSNIFIYNKYLRWYRSIVEGSAERNAHLSEYTEQHHILPVSLFPEFDNLKKHYWNSSKLTYREHFLAHWLLTKCMVQTNHRMKMLNAIVIMCGKSSNQERTLTSHQYDIVKKAAKDAATLRCQNPKYIETLSNRSKEQWQQSSHRELMTDIRNSKDYKERQSMLAAKQWQNDDYRKYKTAQNVKMWQNPDFVEMIKDINRRPEMKAKRSKNASEQWKDPEFLKNNTHYCDCCDRTIVGPGPWVIHLKSKKHLDNCKVK